MDDPIHCVVMLHYDLYFKAGHKGVSWTVTSGYKISDIVTISILISHWHLLDI